MTALMAAACRDFPPSFGNYDRQRRRATSVTGDSLAGRYSPGGRSNIHDGSSRDNARTYRETLLVHGQIIVRHPLDGEALLKGLATRRPIKLCDTLHRRDHL